MRKALFAGALVALVAASAAGQEAIEIKMDKPRVGDRVKITVTEKTDSDLTITVGGNDMAKKEVKGKSFVYVDEVLAVAKDAPKPTKMTRTYEKAETTTDAKSTTLSVEGKKVLIEKKGDKYAYTVDGKPVAADAARILDAEFNKQDKDEARDIMFPKKNLKPGESWRIDAEKLTKGLGGEGLKLDATKIEASGKLTKAYKEDGKQFAVLEIKVAAPITDLGGKGEVKVKDGSLSVSMTGDGCVDGTSPKGKSTTVMEFKINGEGTGFTIKLNAKTTETRTTVPAPK